MNGAVARVKNRKRMSNMIAAFTSVCEEDSVWSESYLIEIDRLGIPFFIHFDRCSRETKNFFKHWCKGYTENDNHSREFNEMDKQGVLDLLQVHKGVTWAMAFDVDEVFERDAPEKLKQVEMLSEVDYLNSSMFNCWGDKGKIRVDSPFDNYHRARFYSLKTGYRWVFRNKAVNGPTLMGKLVTKEGGVDVVCLHLGMMTREMRQHHRERWDRIYRAAMGKNPYNYWNHLCSEEEYPPTVIDNPYL